MAVDSGRDVFSNKLLCKYFAIYLKGLGNALQHEIELAMHISTMPCIYTFDMYLKKTFM